MPSKLAAPAVVNQSGSSSSAETRQFLQERLAVFTAMMFGLYGVVLVTATVLAGLLPESRSANSWLLLTMAGMGVASLGVAYLLLRGSRRWSVRRLYALDALMIVSVGISMGVGAYVGADRPFGVYANLTFGAFFVIGRALFVPSSGRRTLVVSSVSFAAMLAGTVAVALAKPHTVDLPAPILIPLAMTFAGFAVVLAAAGSRVIYGLRQQVRAARQLGQYTLGEKLGEGGMGVVYRARHAMLRRPTAIKLLRSDRASAERLALFEREVQLTAELSHPNTIAVYDYGRSPDGVFYYAMEYLDGVDLETLVHQDGPQPVGRVVDILRQVCGSLDEAHTRGLVHRDIKPANVILCERGKRGDVAKVLDFGLVKDLSGEDHSEDVIAGTPAFLAPECITDPGKVGGASDLYAVGALGYFLLTGRTVFDASTVTEMLEHHTKTPPTAPSVHMDSKIDRGLEQLLMSCLAKRPQERPPSADALEEGLASIACTDWDSEQAAAWWNKRQVDKAPPPEATGFESTMSIDVTGRTELP